MNFIIIIIAKILIIITENKIFGIKTNVKKIVKFLLYLTFWYLTASFPAKMS